MTTTHHHPWQQRVVEEERELRIKTEALGAFLVSAACIELPEDDQSILRWQRKAMLEYLQVLNQRIDRLKP
jgi:hypothetical protein